MNAHTLLLGLTVPLLCDAASAQVLTYTFTGSVTDNTPDPLAAGLFDAVQPGDPFTITYRVDANAPSMMGAPSWNLFTDPVLALSIDIGGVMSSELVGSTIRIEDNFSPPTFQCWDSTVFSSGGTSFSTLDVTLRQITNAPPCPTVTTSFALPTSLNVDDYFFTLMRVVGPGSALLFGDVTDISVSSGPFSEICSGDGGDQMGCTPCPCGNDAPVNTSGGCLNSAGSSARLVPSGSSSIGSADLRFDASGVAPNVAAVLTSGGALAPANMANPCFGSDSGVQSVNLDGLRCVVQGVLRHGARFANTNGEIGATTNGPMTNGWGAPNGFFNFAAFTAGSTRHFQIIHRDDPGAVCMTGQNTSQAVSVVFTH